MTQKINDGLTPQQRYRLKNPDYYKQYNEKWRAEHPEYESQWAAVNADKRAEYAKNYKENTDPERIKEIRKRYYEKNGDRAREYGKRYGKENPERRMLYGARVSAKKQNLPFNLELEDICIPMLCPVLGIPLIVSDNARNDNTPSLDKIIPALGYVKGNVQVISFRANRLKSDASETELLRLVEYLKQQSK